MNATTAAVLALCDTVPGGREQLIEDLLPILAERKFFSAEKVAERYDVSLSCVKVWRAKGLLVPSMKIPGGTARYTLADLEKFEAISGRKGEE